MKLGARFESIREILGLFLATPQPLDQLLKSYLAARRYIGSKDRHFIKDHIFDIFRQWEQVKWGIVLDSRALILSYMCRILKWTLQEFDQNSENSSYALLPLTEIERQFYFSPDFQSTPYPDYVLANVPEFLWLEFQKSFDHDVMDHAKALSHPATFDLRVNTLQTTRTKVLEVLKDLNIDAQATPYADTAVRLSKRLNLETLSLFKSGHIEVQDEGSQLIAYFCHIQPQENILDICAGAGGKTLALAALINNQGKIIATDIDGKRLKNIHGRLERAQVRNVDVRYWPLDKDLGLFDVVVVDSPCSGTGTWRRAPDLRGRWTPEDQDLVVKTQAELLRQASDWVAPSGRLIYITCSMLTSENEQQIDHFLTSNNNFKKTRDIKFSPFTHQTDAFYGAELKRIV